MPFPSPLVLHCSQGVDALADTAALLRQQIQRTRDALASTKR
jgi:hypothetical protein